MGHTHRSCAQRKAELDPDSVSEDDRAFWAHVAEEERPSTLHGVQESDSEEEAEPDYSDSDSEGELYDNVMEWSDVTYIYMKYVK